MPIGAVIATLAMMAGTANAQANVRAVGKRFVPHKLQLKIVKRRRAHGVWPPKVGMCHDQFRKLVRREADFAVLVGGKIGDRLLEMNCRFARPGNCSFQNAADRLRREIAQACED